MFWGLLIIFQKIVPTTLPTQLFQHLSSYHLPFALGLLFCVPISGLIFHYKEYLSLDPSELMSWVKPSTHGSHWCLKKQLNEHPKLKCPEKAILTNEARIHIWLEAHWVQTYWDLSNSKSPTSVHVINLDLLVNSPVCMLLPFHLSLLPNIADFCFFPKRVRLKLQ